MRTVRLALLMFGISMNAAAQTTDQSRPDTAPAPAFGQSAPVLNPENPPVTGLDEPRLELRTATRSFVSPALQVSESADTNGGDQLGSKGLESVTRALGAFDLQQFWPKSDLFLEYLGGGAFYSSPYQARQLHAAGLEAVSRWRTGQVTLRDGFNYLPDGSFQIGFGGAPGLGLATGGMNIGGEGVALPGSHDFGNGQFGAIGNIPRLANTAILDAAQSLNPRSAITVAGGFSNAHFFDSTNTLVNSDQITIQGGYSHLFSRHDQIGVIYGFQLFQFPQNTGGQVYNHIINLRWSRAITGRLSLIAGAGPQYTELERGGYAKNWSLSARHNKRLQSLTFLGIPLGASTGSYNEGSAGAVFRKHLGRSYDLFGSYRFSELAFDTTVCSFGPCGRISQRHVGTVGVEWHPRPTRIE